MADHPFNIVIARAADWAAKGAKCYQKWTCVGCGERLGSERANVFTDFGKCEECGTITDMRKHGCNYMLELGTPELLLDFMTTQKSLRPDDVLGITTTDTKGTGKPKPEKQP